jgi:hypothetical protein
MEIQVSKKVKHIPTGDIVTVTKINRKTLEGTKPGKDIDWLTDKVKVNILECEAYVDPPKEKSFYEIMKERNLEDAKKLGKTPNEIPQYILWLKQAAIERIEKIDKRLDDKIYTFKKKVGDDDYGKFGFSEHYLNLMMHIAYEEGQKNATDRLTRDFESSTRDMKKTIGLIISALDDNDLLPDYDRDNY